MNPNLALVRQPPTFAAAGKTVGLQAERAHDRKGIMQLE